MSKLFTIVRSLLLTERKQTWPKSISEGPAKLIIKNVKRKNHLALRYDIERVDIFNGEVKHHVYVKRQRRICTT